MSTEAKNQSLLERIIDGAIDAVKRPFTIKRTKRAFDSAADSIEEQLLGAQAKQTMAREALVKAAKEEGNLSNHVQKLVDLQGEIRSLKQAQADLATEKSELLG